MSYQRMYDLKKNTHLQEKNQLDIKEAYIFLSFHTNVKFAETDLLYVRLKYCSSIVKQQFNDKNMCSKGRKK